MRIENNREVRSRQAKRWIVLAVAVVAIAVLASLVLTSGR